jgi:hypothetical protein
MPREGDRNHQRVPMKHYTDEELVVLIDQSLKATAEDVREGRIPLDGWARLPLPNTLNEPDEKSAVPDASK